MNKKINALFVSSLLLLVTMQVVLAEEGFSSTAAEEEGYWYSRYNFGSLGMMSGLGETFMPDMQMMMDSMMMVDADFDPTKMDPNYGDGDHPIPPTNPMLLQAVYKSGDPHYTQAIDMMDFSTQAWDSSTFDKTLTGAAQGYTILKLVEWAIQFHVDDHFGKITDDFGAMWRWQGMVLMMEADMQAKYFMENKKSFDLSDGGDYVMLWALSDLAKTRSLDTLPHSDSNRYKNLEMSKMYLESIDSLFIEIKDKNPTSIKEKALAIQSLVWYASTTKNEENKKLALLKIDKVSRELATMEPTNISETAYAIRGLIEAKRVLGIEFKEIYELTDFVFKDFNDSKGIFDSQDTYTTDDMAIIIGALNSLRIFESATVDSGRAEEIFTTLFLTVFNKAGMQQSAPPIPVFKGVFEYKDKPEIYFRYPTVPFPPMAGGTYGIAPVFARSVTYSNGKWTVDRIFDSAGAMHTANELLWLHYDEVNGFPDVDVSTVVTTKAPSTTGPIAIAGIVGLIIGLIVGMTLNKRKKK